jgi:hypothetical protein
VAGHQVCVQAALAGVVPGDTVDGYTKVLLHPSA